MKYNGIKCHCHKSQAEMEDGKKCGKTIKTCVNPTTNWKYYSSLIIMNHNS